MLKSLAGSMKNGAASVWPVLVFALIALGAGLAAMKALSGAVSAATITALVTAVLGVVGTHAGHLAGHELATKPSPAHPPMPGLEKLVQLHADGELTDPEFEKAKKKLLD
jgi:hypothetical protein